MSASPENGLAKAARTTTTMTTSSSAATPAARMAAARQVPGEEREAGCSTGRLFRARSFLSFSLNRIPCSRQAVLERDLRAEAELALRAPGVERAPCELPETGFGELGLELGAAHPAADVVQLHDRGLAS